MHYKVKCKCQHLGTLNGRLFLKRFHEVAEFLLSSSLYSKRTVSAAWVSGQCPLLRKLLWSYEGGCLDFLGIMCGRHKIQVSSWRRQKGQEHRPQQRFPGSSLVCRVGTIKAMELSTSLPHVLPHALPARVGRSAKSAKRSNHVAGHGPEAHIPHAGAGARRTPWSYTLSSVVCPFCPCPWVIGMSVLILCEVSTPPQPG